MKTGAYWMTAPGSPWGPRFVSKEPSQWWWLLKETLHMGEGGSAYRLLSFRNAQSLRGHLFTSFSSKPVSSAEVFLALYCFPEFHCGFYFKGVPGEPVDVCWKYGLSEFMAGGIGRELEVKREQTQHALEVP